MALSDKKQLTLTKKELLVLEELICYYVNHADSDAVDYDFGVGSFELKYSEDDMGDLFFKLESARFS